MSISSIECVYDPVDYYKVRNNHIFTQIDGSMLDSIRSTFTKKHQHIHIFELYLPAIQNLTESIIESISNDGKVTIHIPKQMKDIKTFYDDKFSSIENRWKIVLESGEVSFISYMQNNNSCGVKVNMDFKDGEFTLSSKKFKDDKCIQSGQVYKVNQSIYFREGLINSSIKYSNPYLFKDEIIHDFKKSTPSGILAGFEDDEDIWNFILNETRETDPDFGYDKYYEEDDYDEYDEDDD